MVSAIDSVSPVQRVVWLAFLVAAAAMTTEYFFDPRGALLSPVTCWGLGIAAWATVFSAWRTHRRHLPRISGFVAFCLMFVEAWLVSGLQAAVFPCPPAPDEARYNQLKDAIEAGNVAEVKNLLVNYGPPDRLPRYAYREKDRYADWQRPLETAIEQDNTAIAAALLDRGAVVTDGPYSYESTPLCQAANRGKSAMVRLLLSHTKRINDATGNCYALCMAVESEHPEDKVALLLQAGANPNSWEPDPERRDRRTVLKIAVYKENDRIVRLLKQAGAKE